MNRFLHSDGTTRRGFLRTLVAAGAGAPLLAGAERLEAAVGPRALPGPIDPEDAESIRRLRARYLLADDLIYLNHASIGTVPRPVHEAHVGYLELCESHPSLYVWGSVWRELLEDTRRGLAGFLGCEPDQLAVTHNTTEGFNVLAHGLPLELGDEILFSSLNHPAASVPWRGLAPRRGFDVRSFDFPVERAPELTVDDVVAIHVDALRPETKVLVLPHVDNMVGITHPLREIARAVREHGVEYVLVDGAQSAGMIPVDLWASGVDAYAISAHKWIQAPKGLGLLWISDELRERLPRMWYRTPGDALRASARKYEDYSTRAWPAVVALGDALDFQRSIGAAEKARRYASLWSRIHDRTVDDDRLLWRSPVDPALRSMIVSVGVSGTPASEVAARLLDDVGGVVRPFGPPLDALRLSPNVATSDDEVDRLLDAMISRSG